MFGNFDQGTHAFTCVHFGMHLQGWNSQQMPCGKPTLHCKITFLIKKSCLSNRRNAMCCNIKVGNSAFFDITFVDMIRDWQFVSQNGCRELYNYYIVLSTQEGIEDLFRSNDVYLLSNLITIMSYYCLFWYKLCLIIV